MNDLSDLTSRQGPTVKVRIFEEDKAEFDELQRSLTMAAGGKAVSQAQTIRYLLMRNKDIDKSDAKTS